MRLSAIRRSLDWFKSLPVQRKFVTIGLLVLLLLLSPWLYRGLDELYGRASCSRSGGKWATGGIAQSHFCLRTYPDAGKSCRSSDECMGGCVLYEVIWGQPAPSVGVCKNNNDPFECFAVLEYPQYYGCAD